MIAETERPCIYIHPCGYREELTPLSRRNHSCPKCEAARKKQRVAMHGPVVWEMAA